MKVDVEVGTPTASAAVDEPRPNPFHPCCAAVRLRRASPDRSARGNDLYTYHKNQVRWRSRYGPSETLKRVLPSCLDVGGKMRRVLLFNDTPRVWADQRFSLARVRGYVSQTNDLAQHPVDISLKWVECTGYPCDDDPAVSQPVITCEGEMECSIRKPFALGQHCNLAGHDFRDVTVPR